MNIGPWNVINAKGKNRKCRIWTPNKPAMASRMQQVLTVGVISNRFTLGVVLGLNIAVTLAVYDERRDRPELVR